jgi:hypothetical protein
MASKAEQTSIRMTEQTRLKIRQLIKHAHSSTITGVIELAIDRMYREELVHGRVEPIPDKPKGWRILPD